MTAEHDHAPVRWQSASSVGRVHQGLRRTGLVIAEWCACGAQRWVWLTTFKVEAGAWDTTPGAFAVVSP